MKNGIVRSIGLPPFLSYFAVPATYRSQKIAVLRRLLTASVHAYPQTVIPYWEPLWGPRVGGQFEWPPRWGPHSAKVAKKWLLQILR